MAMSGRRLQFTSGGSSRGERALAGPLGSKVDPESSCRLREPRASDAAHLFFLVVFCFC